jgi:RHH-type proline utilization regulon transcriptional repressor/proline dehydrogenase/delta 1-pyrroline-5-carboxylate dehydrogenase
MRVLVRDAAAADFTVRLTDEVPRIPVPASAARRFSELVDRADLDGFGRLDRLMLRVGARLALVLPRVVMPLVVRRLRKEAAGVILPADDPAFGDHLARRRAEGVRCNVNILGEAIVGTEEARRRLAQVVDLLRRPDVDYVSVKISAVAAGISPLAFDATLTQVCEALRDLYAVAASFEPAKFVNLDMEEYRDLDLTVAAFERVLDEPHLERLDAGVALQAYLPDTRDVARSLGEWANRRRARGGGALKVRLVKGANLAMENVEAELHGWQPAPYGSKHEVDANYKAVLDVLLDPIFDGSVRIGLASHNLFDVAWGIGRREELREAGRPERIEIEMLEGMAPAQAAAVRRLAGGLLVYTPVVDRRDFPSAIAYLVRRLDENTSAENFLAHLFDLAADPAAFDEQAERFAASVRARHGVDAARRRTASRVVPMATTPLSAPFSNAPDTDWTHPDNRRWITRVLAEPLDFSREMFVPPTTADVDTAVSRAGAACAGWSAIAANERAEIINRAGDVFEAHRGRILATMVADANKSVAEGDPEVSEAVDFARYYARAALRLDDIAGARPSPLGPVVVAPPWNFPLAIPAGGVLAALAAGNSVILKPAPQSRATAALIAELCWTAGLDPDLLQVVPTDDDAAGCRLITHPDVAAVILTGSYATAQMFLGWRPDLRLHAETSGKNSIVITATADIDRAVMDLVRSAFGHAGQKCSAASLVIVEAPLYDDPAFLERVRDAAASLRVGPADDVATEIGPLIERPGEVLQRALTRLEPGEQWLLRPEARSDDQRLWSPGVRIGVHPGSWFARTECFGPVLGIIRADDFDHAVQIQNDSEYGLTAGLQSLDPDEIALWTERVEAGNLYVNRGITGAIVRRQPFGGWKRSVVGPTAQAGGPNYVDTLVRWHDTGVDINAVTAAYQRWMRDIGDREHDSTGLAAERNAHRYRALSGGVLVRCGSNATDRARELVAAASSATGARTVWSDATGEPAAVLCGRLGALGIDRLRLIGDEGEAASHDIRSAAHAAGLSIDDAPPVGAPEIELPRWLREQSVTTTMHRHGRVPDDVSRARTHRT